MRKKSDASNFSIETAGNYEEGTSSEISYTPPVEYEEKFKLVFENAPLGIAIIDPSWKIIDANNKFCSIINYSCNDIVGIDIREITFSADLGSTFQLMKKIQNGELDSYELKKRYIKSTGQLVPVKVHSAAIRGDNGKLIYSVLMVQDLSDEESKSEQLKLLGHSINCISEMVSITDNEDKFIFINKAFKDRYGYTEEEIIGQTPKIINTDHVRNQGVLKDAKEKRWTGELINKTKIGEIFPIALETSVVENDSGLAIGFIGVAKDLSQQKKVEESLKKLSKAVEQNPAAIMITDRDGYIEYVNPKFYEITGYSIDEVIGKNPRFLKSGNKSEREYQELWDIILSGNEWRGEFVNKKKNGEIFQEYAIISPIKDSSGTITHFVGVKEDITAKKEAEENLQRSENLATLGRMTSYLSHEIKTPLTAIKLNVEMLMEQLESNNAYEKPFQIIDKEIKRLEKLLKDVLQFSKNKDNILSEISLNELLEQVIDLLNPVLREKKIEIQNNISSERINGDTGELKTLFHQLIENSMDAIEHKGLIEFRSVIDKKTNMHRIFVRDNGCGIKVPKKIFEPFFSTKQSGTGLGLSIVQQIIEKHKGTISLVFSEPGNTIFQVSLPLFK